MILTLHEFWSARGCVILQPYDMRMGAGTFHTATTLRALGPEPWAQWVRPGLQDRGVPENGPGPEICPSRRLGTHPFWRGCVRDAGRRAR